MTIHQSYQKQREGMYFGAISEEQAISQADKDCLRIIARWSKGLEDNRELHTALNSLEDEYRGPKLKQIIDAIKIGVHFEGEQREAIVKRNWGPLYRYLMRRYSP